MVYFSSTTIFTTFASEHVYTNKICQEVQKYTDWDVDEVEAPAKHNVIKEEVTVNFYNSYFRSKDIIYIKYSVGCCSRRIKSKAMVTRKNYLHFNNCDLSIQQ